MSKRNPSRHVPAKAQPRIIFARITKTVSRAALGRSALRGAAYRIGYELAGWLLPKVLAFLAFLAALHIVLFLWLAGALPQPVPDGAACMAIDRHSAYLIAVIGFLRRGAARLRAAANKLKLGLTLGNGGIAYA